jgi:hypothetical protein
MTLIMNYEAGLKLMMMPTRFVYGSQGNGMGSCGLDASRSG